MEKYKLARKIQYYEDMVEKTEEKREEYMKKLRKLRDMCDHEYKWELQGVEIVRDWGPRWEDKVHLIKECKICSKVKAGSIKTKELELIEDEIGKKILNKIKKKYKKEGICFDGC